MKKQIIALAVAALVASTMLTGCRVKLVDVTSKSNNGTSQASKAKGASSKSAASKGASSSKSKTNNAGTPADAYGRYADLKGNAYNRISKKIDANPELSLSVGMAILPVAMIDLTLIPLTIVGSPGGTAALALLGMQDVKVDQKGSVYTITYKDKDGNSLTQTCEYDAGTDSMTSTIKTGDKDSLAFEFVKAGNGYACQYASQQDDGSYQLITGFFDDSSIVGFGIATVSAIPASIYKKTGLTQDFIKNDQSYFVLQDNKLTVFEKGETKTY